MALQLEGGGEEAGRKRRGHKKSRLGCRNCKLRRVKCDETRPTCKNCTTFGVSCNYDSKTPDLQVSIGESARFKVPQQTLCSIEQPLVGIVRLPPCPIPSVISDGHSKLELDRQAMNRLVKFQLRTVLTVGTARSSAIHQESVFRLATSYPYLMHAVQSITAIHDRYLLGMPDARPKITEVYHWSRATTLFNQKLSSRILPSERDAIWATASLLGVIAFACVEATRPEESWPLKPAETCDLEWLQMTDGKKAVWKLADPLRPESVFHELAKEHSDVYVLSSAINLNDLPSELIQLCGVNEYSTPENNPCYTAVFTLASLFLIECNQSNILKFLYYIMNMDPGFKSLLEQKDPRALVLTAYWYSKVCYSQWWIAYRAVVEGRAICLYLDKFYGREKAIQELMRFPKRQFGLLA